MSTETKLSNIKTILGISGDSMDEEISIYLDLCDVEILNWLYSGKVPDGVTTIPTEYDVTEVYAVVAGYSHKGGNDEVMHNENGINREFRHSDMLDYIHREIIPYARLL